MQHTKNTVYNWPNVLLSNVLFSETTFNETCCKEKGVQPQCMGLCMDVSVHLRTMNFCTQYEETVKECIVIASGILTHIRI